MRLSRYFLPTTKETPADATIASHRYMLRAGMVRQLGSGIYNWLPLGLKVLRRIEKIIHEEITKAGAVEILMPTVQPAELWQESGRYDDYGKEMLRITDRHDHAMLYGPTNEEVVVDIFRQNVSSYKDLPLNLYQIQWKFRDEIRPRFGVMRGREFLMKDGYSFDIDFESAKKTYDSMYRSYMHIFKRLGLSAVAVRADNGAIGGKLSHEFQILANTGESDVYYDEALEPLLAKDTLDLEAIMDCYAMADEMYNEKDCPVPKENLKQSKGIEVGHIFHFGDKYSKALNAVVNDQNGKIIHPEMGSYGIGVSRLVGAIIEAYHDEQGIIWPESVAPFDIGLINIRPGDQACDALCDKLYDILTNAGKSVLYDDTKNSAGKKFANMDLIGLPWQAAIGPRGAEKNEIELKRRDSGEKHTLSVEAAITKLTT